MSFLNTVASLVKYSLAQNSSYVLSKIKSQPRSMTIAVTSRCNFRCKMCNYWKGDVKQKLATELTTDEIKELILQAKSIGVKYVTFQ